MGVLDAVMQYKAKKEAQEAQAAQAIPQAVQAFITGRQQQIENQQKNTLLGIQAAQAGYQINPDGSLALDTNSRAYQKDLLASKQAEATLGLTTARMNDLTKKTNAPSGAGDTSIPVDTPEGKQSYINSLPEGTRDIVSQLVKGEMRVGDLQRIPPSQKQEILSASAYLGLNTNKVEERYKARKDFSPGGKIGLGINAVNTAIGHLGSLSTDLENLKNTDSFGVFNETANKAKNYVAEKSGNETGAVLTATKGKVQAVASELMKAYRQVGASQTEVEEWANTFPINGTPKQQKAAIDSAVKLLGSKTNSWNEQWKNTFDAPMDKNIFTPESQGVLKKFGHEDLIGDSGQSVSTKVVGNKTFEKGKDGLWYPKA